MFFGSFYFFGSNFFLIQILSPSLVVSNFDVIVGKQILEGFGFYASWYISTWVPKWNSSFLQAAGGIRQVSSMI